MAGQRHRLESAITTGRADGHYRTAPKERKHIILDNDSPEAIAQLAEHVKKAPTSPTENIIMRQLTNVWVFSDNQERYAELIFQPASAVSRCMPL